MFEYSLERYNNYLNKASDKQSVVLKIS